MNDRTTIAIPLAEVRSKMQARNTPKGPPIHPQARHHCAAFFNV